MANIDYNKIIEDNLGLILSIVKKFKPKNQDDFAEMVQCGRIGLWKAINKHNPSLGKLTTVAYRPILWEIYLYIRQKNRAKREFAKIEYLNNTEDINEILPNLSKLEISIFKDLAANESKINICKKNNISYTKLKNIIKEIYDKINEANK